jgi:hypothetical protein
MARVLLLGRCEARLVSARCRLADDGHGTHLSWTRHTRTVWLSMPVGQPEWHSDHAAGNAIDVFREGE